MTVQALRRTSASFDSARRDAAHFIDGAFTEGTTGKFWENHTPLDNSVIGRVPEGGKAEIDAAVRAAKAALSGPWGKMTVAERTDILGKVADGINARLEEFLAAECLDTGKPSSLARHLDIPRGAANFKMFADTVKGVSTETFMLPTPDGKGALNYGLRRPKGVIAVISPWNLPLLLMTWKVGPALACGNAVVVKPSEETPLTATLLGEVMNEAGVPKGVYNVVHGFGPNSAGEFLTQHPLVNGITFTGETRTGEAIMRQAALGLRQVSFELGGKNPALVFADADLDKAIEGTMRSCFSNCGQVCLGTERVYVERPIFDAFVARLKAGAEGLKLGRPEDPSTNLGPLVSQEHRAEGAELLQEGGRGGRDHRHRRRRPEYAGRARQRRLDRAHDLDGPARRLADRQRGDFWTLLPYPSVRYGGGGRAARQFDAVRSGGLGVDREPVAWPPRRGADGRRHLLGQLLVSARPAHRLRRRQAVGHRPRRGTAFARVLHRTHQRLRQALRREAS